MNHEKRWLWLGLAAAAAALCLLILSQWQPDPGKSANTGTATSTQQTVGTDAAPTAQTEASTAPSAALEETTQLSTELPHGLRIESIGSYTGIYVEDGTNDIVSDVTMVLLSNEGEDTIVYGELTIDDGSRILEFSFSTLPAGEKLVLLELNRQPYIPTDSYTPELNNLALADAPLSLEEDKLSYHVVDNIINVTNISGEDITGDILIYYKNSGQDLLYGGITYRIRISGGLKADEIRQLLADHFLANGSRIMFVTIG